MHGTGVRDVGPDGRHADEEPEGNLFVGPSAHDEVHHLLLARNQLISRRCAGAPARGRAPRQHGPPNRKIARRATVP
jgi:hypothetical protein